MSWLGLARQGGPFFGEEKLPNLYLEFLITVDKLKIGVVRIEDVSPKDEDVSPKDMEERTKKLMPAA